jgi:hypothetical protein
MSQSTNTQAIDITGLDKIELLERLWTKQIVAAFFRMSGVPSPKFDRGQAAKAVKENYIDYFCGRCIKASLNKDTVNPTWYDSDAGAGTFANIVSEMRANK